MSIAVALHTYPAENETEMTLEEGMEYSILEKNESGWWHVSDGAHTGWAPSNYLKEIEGGLADPASAPPPMEPMMGEPMMGEAESEPMGQSMATPIPEPMPMAAPEPEPMNGAPDQPNGANGASVDVESALEQIKQMQDAKNCHSCEKPITSEFVMAKGRHFCVGCFTCTTCGTSLAGKGYVERDGGYYCEGCYHQKFSPHCARCDIVIKGQYISALDQTWCPGCFSCASCNRQFDTDQFRKRNGQPYCESCYAENFAVNCDKCGLPIQGKAFNAQDKNYHQECFVCVKGCAIAETDSFHVRDGEIYCRNCYRADFVKTCFRCKQDISGKYICVLEKYFHDECWTCATCGRSMMDGEFRQVNDDFHCLTCAPAGAVDHQESRMLDERPAGVPAGGAPKLQPPTNPYNGGGPPMSAPVVQRSPPTPKQAVAPSPVHKSPTPMSAPPSSPPVFAPSLSPPASSPVASRKPYATPTGMEYVVGEDNSYMQSQKEQEEPQAIETCYSYMQLKDPVGLPERIDRARLERYLSDREFKEVFKMLPSDFETLAEWKKKSLKKKAGLF